MEIISVGMNDSYDVLCFDLYLVNLKNLWRQRDVHMLCSSWHFMFICIVKRSKFITKIQIWRYKYFRRTLFCCLWFYLRYTVGTQHECVPNFSYPLSYSQIPPNVLCLILTLGDHISNFKSYEKFRTYETPM